VASVAPIDSEASECPMARRFTPCSVGVSTATKLEAAFPPKVPGRPSFPAEGLTSAPVSPAEPSVCAVAPPEINLGRQTHRVASIVALGADRDLSAAVAAAATRGSDWIWLLAPDVVPAPDALARLLAPLDDAESLEGPVLLASKLVTPDGSLDLGTPPWPRMLARELAFLGAEHRLMVLRAVRYGSILISRGAIERHGPPRPDFADGADDLEWTGRILRDQPGFLVPQSVVTRSAPLAVEPAGYARNRVRILRGGGWRAQERAWFAFLLASDLAQSVAARPAQAPAMVRAIAGGLRAPI